MEALIQPMDGRLPRRPRSPVHGPFFLCAILGPATVEAKDVPGQQQEDPHLRDKLGLDPHAFVPVGAPRLGASASTGTKSPLEGHELSVGATEDLVVPVAKGGSADLLRPGPVAEDRYVHLGIMERRALEQGRSAEARP